MSALAQLGHVTATQKWVAKPAWQKAQLEGCGAHCDSSPCQWCCKALCSAQEQVEIVPEQQEILNKKCSKVIQKKGDVQKEEHQVQHLAPKGKAASLDNMTKQTAI